jgi:hypothetical protein
MHNGLILLITREDGLLPLLKNAGFVDPHTEEVSPPQRWLIGAGIVLLIGLALCLKRSRRAGAEVADDFGQSGRNLVGVPDQQRAAVED